MYAPATSGLPAAPLAQAGVLAGQAASGEVPAPVAAQLGSLATALHVSRAELNVLAGHSATIAGTLATRGSGDRRSVDLAGGVVVLQVRERGGWRTLAGARTGARGRYRLGYRPGRIGSLMARLRFAGGAGDRGSHRRLGQLNVYRLVGASWYGGGGSLACGGWLTSSTLGVANKTLPCGTLVTLRYGGRTVRVPVIDRGPYVAGREFDLTEATKRALGFEGVGEVWADR